MTPRPALARLGAEAVHLCARLRERPRPSRNAARRPAVALRRAISRRISISPFRARSRRARRCRCRSTCRRSSCSNELGPARLLARLQQGGVRDVSCRRRPRPASRSASAGSASRSTDLTRLYAGLARGGDDAGCVRRADAARERRHEPEPIADPVAAWYVVDILRGAPPPDNALAGRIAFKTGTSYGYRDAWAVGYRPALHGRRLGRPAGRDAVPGLVGRVVAAPILFDAFARLGGEPEPLAAAAAGPASRRRRPCRRRCGICARTCRRPSPRRSALRCKIAFPLDGARVDLGLRAADPHARARR